MANKYKNKRQQEIIEQVKARTYKSDRKKRYEQRDENLRKQQADIAPVKSSESGGSGGFSARGKIQEQNIFQKTGSVISGAGGNFLMAMEGTMSNATKAVNDIAEYGTKKLMSLATNKFLEGKGVEEEKREAISNVLGSVGSNIAIGSTELGKTNKELNSEEREKWREETIQSNLKKVNEGGEVGRFVNDVAMGVGQNVIPMAISLVPGGQGVGTALFIASATGSYLEDAEQRGMNEDEKMAYATTMGAWEGGFDALSTLFVGKALKLAGKGELLSGTGLKTFLFGGLMNAGQEGLTEPAQELTADVIADKGDWEDIESRMLRSALVGFITGLIFQGIGAGIGKATYAFNVHNNTNQATKTAEQQLRRKLTAEETTQIQEQIKQQIKAQMTDVSELNAEERAEIEELSNLPYEDMIVKVAEDVANSGEVDVNEIAKGVNEALNEQTLAPVKQAEQLQLELAEKEAELKQTEDRREREIIQDKINVIQEELAPVQQATETNEILNKTKENVKKYNNAEMVKLEDIIDLKEDGGYKTAEEIQDVENSIKENGIQNPIELTVDNEGNLVMNNGNHRLEIASKLGLTEVPVTVVTDEGRVKYSDFINQETTEHVQQEKTTNLKQKAFTQEINENDSDYKKAVYESASKVMNDTEQAHKLADVVAKIAEEKGTKYRFVNNETIKQEGYNVEGKTVNGLVNENGEVLINVESKKYLDKVLGHETTHLLEGTQEYEDLKQMAIKYAKQTGQYQSRLDELNSLYEGRNVDVEKELTSDIVGDYLFTNEQFLQELSVQKPTLFQKIKNLIDDLVVKFKGTAEEKALRDLQRSFEKAYRTENKTTNREVEFAIEDSKIQGLESYSRDEIKTITESHIKEKLEENGIDDVNIKGLEIHGSRNRGTAKTISDLDVVVEYEGDIREDDLFDILNEDSLEIEGIKVDINPITASNTGTLAEYMERSNAYDKDVIAKLNKAPTTDNKGRELSKEQKEFFKESKAKDEEGNLLTLYHGTKADFNIFEIERAGQNYENNWSESGRGFYFTDEIKEARDFAETAEGDITYIKEVYLDMKNPFDTSKDYRIELSKMAEEYGISDYYMESGVLLRNWLKSEKLDIQDVLKKYGFDGIIDHGHYVVFESSQVKNVDNTTPTKNDDIRYSLSEDTKGRKLSEQQIARYKNVSPELKDENGNLKIYYHGTKRADRVGTVFDPNKATSGPMAFFTDNNEIAESYSKGKQDTSLSREYDTEYDLFKADGMDLDTYWNSLSRAEQQKIAEEANNVGFDDDWENIIYGEKASENSFSDQYKWRLKNEYKGNALKSLYGVWVEDGNLMFEDMSKFKEVLELSGVKNVEYLDIYKEDPKVYETYLNIKNPLNTSNISEDIVNQLKEASKTATIGEQYSADGWDKSNIAPESWLNILEDDLAKGTAHAWTVIPDWVTDVLKANGFDGIVDRGGKHGGEEHQVVIPFYSEQIKSVENQNPTDNPDINLSLSNQNEEDTAPRGNFTSEDVKLQVQEAIAPLQETINNLTEQIEAIVPVIQQETAPVQVQPTTPTQEEIDNLMEIKKQSGSDYARAFYELRDKYGQTTLYKALNQYYSDGTVPSEVTVDENIAPTSQDIVEAQNEEAFNNITENDVPKSWEEGVEEAFDDFIDLEGSTENTTIESPLKDRNIEDVGDRKIKAYQYENPEVKPYFQTEAQNMLGDLRESVKGERYPIFGEDGYVDHWTGTTRLTTDDIAYLKDVYGYSYKQIEEGLNKIIEDDGLENNAVSKRIEFMLDERLREGYTGIDGYRYPPNQEYINFLEEKQIIEYNLENFNAITDNDAPVEEETLTTPSQINENTVLTEEAPQVIEDVAPVVETAQNGNTEQISTQETPTKEKQRSWVETSTESEAVGRKVLPEDMDLKKITYQPITNQNTLSKANAKLNSLGYEKALNSFNNMISSGMRVKAEDITLGERLVQEAIKRGDTANAIELIENISILGTEIGQTTQALSIIKRLTPAGQLKMLEKTVDRAKIKGNKSFETVELTDEMKKKILDVYNDDGVTYDQDRLNRTMEDVKQELANQIKATTLDKVNAWRYLAMLGNPKTHIRNLVSNVAMLGTTEVKNAVARTIETVAPVQNRTKTWEQSSKAVKDFAEQTATEMKDIISGDNKYNDETGIKTLARTFENEILEKTYNFNSDLLEKEDWWFSKPRFKKALSEFLTANGIKTEEDIFLNPELVDKGRLYATEQARIATFRQYSYLANKIREIENKNTATNIAVGSILPFKKTPINIAKTGLAYSPLGFAKTLTYDISQVKKGNMEASQLVDNLSQNLTGSALVLAGTMLAMSGFLNGSGEDDEEGKYDYQLGKQSYSLNIDGKSYSLSWLSPVAMPLFVGANMFEQLVEKEEWNGDVVVETLAQTLDPLNEMSFLSSLTDVLSSYETGTQKFAGIFETMAQNYATQFVPTLSSQVASTLDDTKRTTKVGADSDFKFVDETINRLIYKIPGLRETLEPSTDIWGNEVKQTEDVLTRAFESFISPYSKKESTATEIDENIKEVFSATGDNGVIPNVPRNTVKFENEDYKMSAKDYTAFKKTYGQTANDLLEDLFRTTTYKQAGSDEKADMINDVYDYASDIAKKDYLSQEGVKYTNTTKEGVKVYKENDIKKAIENDMSVDEYRLYDESPEKYEFLQENNISFDEYSANKEEYNYAFKNPEKYAVAKAITDDYKTYTEYSKSINDLKADKDEDGDSISGSRRDKVISYVNSLDLSIPQKAMLIRNEYSTFKEYNNEIVEYVNSLNIDTADKVKILEGLKMTVDDEGNVYWK